MEVTPAGPSPTAAEHSAREKGKGASYSITNIFIFGYLIYIFIPTFQRH